MAKSSNPLNAIETQGKRFGTEKEVEALTGIPVSTLQKYRFYKDKTFPYYKIRRRVMYDLDEVETLIRATRK